MELHLPDMNGTELFGELERRGITIPVIFLTGFGDVATAVRVLRSGAFDFIEKPCDRWTLLERIGQAIIFGELRRSELAERRDVENRMAALGPGENEVLDRIMAGASNKNMATELGLTERAVEYRRASLMKKLGASSLAEVVQMATIYFRMSADDRNSKIKPHINAPHFRVKQREHTSTTRKQVSPPR